MYCEVMWPNVIKANVAGSDRARVSRIRQTNSLLFSIWIQVVVIFHVNAVWNKYRPRRSDGDGGLLCCWAIRGVLTLSWRFMSSAMVSLFLFVNLFLFDFKILLTVPLMSIDHVWIVTNAGNRITNIIKLQHCWYHASAPMGMTVFVSEERGGVRVLGLTPLTL